MKFGTLKNRITELEADLHIIILLDRRRWIPKSSGIRLSFQIMKLGRDLGRPPQLDDSIPRIREKFAIMRCGTRTPESMARYPCLHPIKPAKSWPGASRLEARQFAITDIQTGAALYA
jgi:hypothetical protein